MLGDTISLDLAAEVAVQTGLVNNVDLMLLPAILVGGRI